MSSGGRAKRVLLVSYHFPPSDRVGARRAGRIAEHMARLGYFVDVLCASMDGVGSPDPGESWSVPPGSSVVRIPTPFRFFRNPSEVPGDGRSRLWWKLRAYAERLFLKDDWSFRWGQEAAREAMPRLVRGEFDVVIAEGPPNPAVVPILRAARRNGTPVLVDLRDMWPSSSLWWLKSLPPGLVPFPGLRRDLWNLRLKTETLLGASVIVVTTSAIADLLAADAESMGVQSPPIHVVTNAFDAPDHGELAVVRHRDSAVRLAYTGSLAYGRDGQMIDLIRAISSIRSETEDGIVLEIVGPPQPGFAEAISNGPDTDFLKISGPVARQDAVRIQRKADALVLLQPEDKSWTRAAIPAKLFEYMERRRNILAIVPRGPAADIVERHGLGCVVADPAGLENGVRLLVRRVRSRRVLPPPPEEFSSEATMARFAGIVDAIVGSGGP